METLAAIVLLMAPQQPAELLEARCVGCHHPGRRKADLDLTTRAGLLKGGHTGTAVVPGNAKGSFLYRVAAHLEEPHMPHKSPRLSTADLDRLAAWINAGAPYDRTLVAPRENKEERLWSLAPLQRPAPPDVRGKEWIRTPIDRFILARLEAKDLAPSGSANRRTLIRRATFDLIGLPPTPEEIEVFVKDDAPDAYGRLVDRLLASRHYGERWGRHWLDVARYADSSGYESDFDQKLAYRYRDFVIRALNDDLPFDTFVRWQLAGDEIAPENPDAVTATGFCTVGSWVRFRPSETAIQNEKKRYDELDDILSTTASAFLGLTIGCARCHDHKFDPILQSDYYELAACFAPSIRKERSLSAPVRRLEEWVESRRYALRCEKIDALPLDDEKKMYLRYERDGNVVTSKRVHDKYGKKIRVDDPELREWLSDDDRRHWDRLKKEAGRTKNAPRALALFPLESEVKTHLLGRGMADNKLREVGPGFISSVAPTPDPIPPGRRRAALAAWMTDVDNGAGRLLARVTANRLWAYHFGDGIVSTPNDFGFQGARPTHPELLDWLACELVDRAWRLKALHRLIMTSAVYVQDAMVEAAKVNADPMNRLYGRRRPRRLESEILRDSILAVSGRLNRTLYGPAVRVRIPKSAMSTRTKNAYPADLEEGPKNWRRSCYLFVKRSVMTPMLELFDGPNASASCGRRNRTTVAPQALTLLNDPFLRDRARDFAARVARDAGRDPRARVHRAFALALGRRPTDPELEASLEFLADADSRTLTDFCQTLFSLNEFVYVD